MTIAPNAAHPRSTPRFPTPQEMSRYRAHCDCAIGTFSCLPEPASSNFIDVRAGEVHSDLSLRNGSSLSQTIKKPKQILLTALTWGIKVTHLLRIFNSILSVSLSFSSALFSSTLLSFFLCRQPTYFLPFPYSISPRPSFCPYFMTVFLTFHSLTPIPLLNPFTISPFPFILVHIHHHFSLLTSSFCLSSQFSLILIIHHPTFPSFLSSSHPLNSSPFHSLSFHPLPTIPSPLLPYPPSFPSSSPLPSPTSSFPPLSLFLHLSSLPFFLSPPLSPLLSSSHFLLPPLLPIPPNLPLPSPPISSPRSRLIITPHFCPLPSSLPPIPLPFIPCLPHLPYSPPDFPPTLPSPFTSFLPGPLPLPSPPVPPLPSLFLLLHLSPPSFAPPLHSFLSILLYLSLLRVWIMVSVRPKLLPKILSSLHLLSPLSCFHE
ncbi:hypothetical protein C7M84_022432 [Penaeus vannamei]|uniref:Uncharacterized protein n=1 Tax=Penaeus vannamei TaxID=6689 RepID=A0A3R7MKW1_PENVA|nr:hypothetical protein C7M84_022432 [Penaeus vannamei]